MTTGGKLAELLYQCERGYKANCVQFGCIYPFSHVSIFLKGSLARFSYDMAEMRSQMVRYGLRGKGGNGEVQ